MQNLLWTAKEMNASAEHWFGSRLLRSTPVHALFDIALAHQLLVYTGQKSARHFFGLGSALGKNGWEPTVLFALPPENECMTLILCPQKTAEEATSLPVCGTEFDDPVIGVHPTRSGKVLLIGANLAAKELLADSDLSFLSDLAGSLDSAHSASNLLSNNRVEGKLTLSPNKTFLDISSFRVGGRSHYLSLCPSTTSPIAPKLPSPILTWTLSDARVNQTWTPSILTHLGYSEDQWVLKPFAQFVQSSQDTSDNPQVIDMLHKSGKVIRILASIFRPIPNRSDFAVHAVVASRDFTVPTRLRMRRSLSDPQLTPRTIDMHVSTDMWMFLSHEVRTPMQSIIGFAEELRHDERHHVKETANRIDAACTMAMEMINHTAKFMYEDVMDEDADLSNVVAVTERACVALRGVSALKKVDVSATFSSDVRDL